MLAYTVHRILIMVPTMIAISVIVFVIIQLPPGDIFENLNQEMESRGEAADWRAPSAERDVSVMEWSVEEWVSI